MQATTIQPAPAPAPALPQEPAIPAPPRVTVAREQVSGSPRATYEAARAKREVLGEYMSRLLNRRENVADRLNQPNVTPAEKAALEEHLKELNARIIDMEKQLHAADAEVAAAAGVPGATTREPRGPDSRSGPSEDVYIAGIIFGGTASLIMAIAYARRLWRGATKVVAQFPPALEARFTRFEQALDAMAIEIERVSEGQRFLTKILGEQGQRAIGAGPAQPIETRAAAAEPVRRA